MLEMSLPRPGCDDEVRLMRAKLWFIESDSMARISSHMIGRFFGKWVSLQDGSERGKLSGLQRRNRMVDVSSTSHGMIEANLFGFNLTGVANA
jgi:hypothetical protein